MKHLNLSKLFYFPDVAMTEASKAYLAQLVDEGFPLQFDLMEDREPLEDLFNMGNLDFHPGVAPKKV